jgi:L-histidine Nalpha-methyltransferase
VAPTYQILRRAERPARDQDAFARDVLIGLSAARKFIPCKYFYDARGSALFDRITELPEYYPTRCELEILERDKETIARHVGEAPFNLVELGPGCGAKTLLLLSHLNRRGLDFQYVPIDISESAMRSLLAMLGARLPGQRVLGLVAEYQEGLRWLNRRDGRRNVVLFLGSSIGNFTPGEASAFMLDLWNSLRHDDLVLTGFDLKKDVDLLLRAYNDAQGVTRQFNLNLLGRINRELGGHFELSRFEHFGTYNAATGAMESYLLSLAQQSVLIEDLGRSFSFEPWEPVHTEFSHKFLLTDIDRLACATGFRVVAHLSDARGFFADSLWSVDKPAYGIRLERRPSDLETSLEETAAE